MAEQRTGPAAAAGAPRIERTFVDSDGTRWSVYEQPFADYDRRRGISLIFASDAAMRRVRDYPDNWRTLSDTELASMSWRV